VRSHGLKHCLCLESHKRLPPPGSKRERFSREVLTFIPLAQRGGSSCQTEVGFRRKVLRISLMTEILHPTNREFEERSVPESTCSSGDGTPRNHLFFGYAEVMCGLSH